MATNNDNISLEQKQARLKDLDNLIWESKAKALQERKEWREKWTRTIRLLELERMELKEDIETIGGNG